MRETIEGWSAWLEEALQVAAAALARAGDLRPAVAERITRLPLRFERYPSGALLDSWGMQSDAKWIISGWVSQMRILPDARRQIFAFMLPGDIMPAQGSRTPPPYVLQALSRVDCVDVGQLLAAAPAESDRHGLERAIAGSLALAEVRKYDHVVRLGQHTAAERISNLLIELRDRLAPLGLASSDSFRLPLTQEHLADALGLSLVHVHRTLKALRRQGVVEMRLGRVTLIRPDRAEQLAFGGGSP